jgi:hypothetical protein
MTDDVNNAASWAEHMRSEFETLDVEQALRTMTPEPCVNCVPTMTGGFGAAEVRRTPVDQPGRQCPRAGAVQAWR